MYKKVPTTLNFVEREKETLKFWKDNQIFEKSVQLRQGAPAYTFFDGPPTANGKPHIGHVLTRAMKDIIPRYKTMRSDITSHSPLYFHTDSLHFWMKGITPYCSICSFPSRPSSFSTSSSTGRPWVSQPALRSTS